MQHIQFLHNPQGWRAALGLLPIPLMRGSEELSRYVLMNGQGGNFCLDLSLKGPEPKKRRSNAWSANVGHYVTLQHDAIELLRWDQPEKVERYSLTSVADNLEKFHNYLERNDPNQQNSIVQHCLKVFRTLRNILREESLGFQSLDCFLVLLACITDSEERKTVDPDLWGLTSSALEIASTINNVDWEMLTMHLSGIGGYKGLQPDYKLMLRHASGALFQEAHYQAQVPSQSWLPGFGTSDLHAPVARTPYGGIFFTPQSIARTLAEETIRHLDLTRPVLKIFDPACGSGELLKETLRILELKGYRGHIKIIGWDISPGAINMARVALAWEKRYWLEGTLNVELLQKNSLEVSWPSDVDMLVMNPPFKSWQSMTPDEQDQTAQLLSDILHNKPNLAAVFTKIAIDSLRENGVLGMIAPSSFFDGDSTSKLRVYVAASIQPMMIAKLGNQSIFFNAMVDAGLFVGQKSNRQNNYGPIMVWADHTRDSVSAALRALRKQQDVEILPVDEETFSLYRDPKSGTSGKAWSPRQYKPWLQYQKASTGANSIAAGKIFVIRQGARLGHDVFVLSKRKLMMFQPEERKYFRPAVMNASLQWSMLNDDDYVFFPYTDGLQKINTEDELGKYVPEYYNDYLKPVEAKLRQRRTLERGMNWWDLSWPRSWQYKKSKKIVSKYFGKEGSFAWDNTGEFAVVVGHAWIPRKDGLFENEYFPLAMIAYLNSRLAETIMSCISPHVGGGQWDLSNKYMLSLPIPNLETVKPTLLKALSDIGKKLTLGQEVDLDSLDELCDIALHDTSLHRLKI